MCLKGPVCFSVSALFLANTTISSPHAILSLAVTKDVTVHTVEELKILTESREKVVRLEAHTGVVQTVA